MGTTKQSNIAVVAILIFAGFGMVSVILWPPYPRAHRFSDTELRQSSLRTVGGFIIKSYPEMHDGLLPQPNQWLEARFTDVYPEPMFGDNYQDDIWMSPIPWEDGRIPADITQEELAQLPMLHEKVSLNPDGTSVAFWDGDVRLLSNEEFEGLIDIKDSVCLGCQFPVPEFMREQGP